MDGCRIVTMHERSFYTVNIYLNGDFKGGYCVIYVKAIACPHCSIMYAGGTTDFLESIYRDPADRKARNEYTK